MKDFNETLAEFEVKNFKVDLAIINGDIAVNDFGDLMLTNKEVDSFYRFFIKWRRQTPTIESLFNLWKINRAERINIENNKKINSFPDHVITYEEAQSYREAESAIAGTIFVILSTLLSTLIRSKPHNSSIKFKGIAITRVITSSANNFRHYDEWSNLNKTYDSRQLKNVETLSKILDLQCVGNKKAITSNVCSDVLYELTNLEINGLFSLVRRYIKEAWDSIEKASST